MALEKLIQSQSLDKVESLDKTSSLKQHFLCDYCGRKELNKKALVLHIQSCITNRTCSWCKIVFKNRGCLFNHCSYLHGQTLWQKDEIRKTFDCTACPKSYKQGKYLKYHIRKDHCNLITEIFCRENKEVNDVWLERVMNSDAVIEIRKTGQNSGFENGLDSQLEQIDGAAVGMSPKILRRYLMRRVRNDSTRKITEVKDSLDLTLLYPTSVRKYSSWCDICKRTFSRRNLEKHVDERHRNLRQHKCNNCNKSFPRLYQYLRHNCMRISRKTSPYVKKIDCVIVDD